MKYWLGAPEDHTSVVYDGITGYSKESKIRTFGKKELKDLLKTSGFEYTNFYYPLPDYKLPTVIFSDEYLPTVDTIENYIPYYYEQTIAQFDEKKAYREVIKNNMFDFFANSFFVEASQNELNTKVTLSEQKLIPISEVSKKFYDKDYTNKNESKQLEELKVENERLKRELEGIKDSRTWKMMEPIRKLKGRK